MVTDKSRIAGRQSVDQLLGLLYETCRGLVYP